MKTTPSRLLPISLLIAASPFASAAITIIDDFNDGNDTGWTHKSSVPGKSGAFAFPGGNTYQITAPAAGGTFGPARTGSVHLDQTYTSFYQQVDIVDRDPTNMSATAGLVARGASFGLQTTDGYLLTLTAGGAFTLYRVDNESPTSLVGQTVALSPTADYRMIFTGDGSTLTGQLFNLSNLSRVIATVNFTDTTYSSGVSGLYVFDGSAAGISSATATFDNYVSADSASAVPESSTFSAFGIGLGLLILRRRLA